MNAGKANRTMVRKNIIRRAFLLVAIPIAVSCASTGASSPGTSASAPSAESRLKGRLDAWAVAAERDKAGCSFARGIGWAVAGSEDLSTIVFSQAFTPLAVNGKLALHASYMHLWSADVKGPYPTPSGNPPTLNLGWPDILHGASLAVSKEGDCILTGAPDREKGAGAIYFYSKVDGQWRWDDQGNINTLFGLFGNARNDGWGTSVDVSESGKTLVWGAPGEAGHGMVHYLVKPAEGWAAMIKSGKANFVGGQLGAPSTKAVRGSDFGRSVAISTDDSTIIVGAPGEGTGTVYYFRKPAEGWMKTRNLLPISPPEGIGATSRFGERVDVSADGKVFAVSAPGANGGAGLVVVYTVKDPDSSDPKFSRFPLEVGEKDKATGSSLTLSSDGRIVAYCCLDGDDSGTVVVRASKAGDWTTSEEVQRNTLTTPAPGDFFGFALAMSRDGKKVAFGAPGAGAGNGVWDVIDIEATK
jgi:hypothetical protein